MFPVPYALTRPFLFGLDPEAAHDLTLGSIARFQNTPDFGDESGNVRKVVRRDPARHQFETRVRERERFGVGLHGVDVANALIRREFARLDEHLRGDVAGGHMCDAWGEREGGVAGGGRNVEQAPVSMGIDEFDEAGKTRAFGMHGGCRVVAGVLAKLALHEAFRVGECRHG
jgi:hypothetical protein